MQLFLHIGTNKTGSSFLQTMLGRNRVLLKENGFYFPVAEREADMLAGKISPGNGGQLCRQLVMANSNGVLAFLKSILEQAGKEGCQSVLISNEKLIRALSHPNALYNMVKAATEAGFSEINILSIFREPVDHALSLYQHRAKEGTHSNFGQWLQEDYETIRMLKNLLPQLDALQHPVKWVFRKYAASPEKMLEILFKDWLGISAPDVKALPSVNPSLSLSEIQFLQLLRVHNPVALKPVKAGFDKLTKKQKADDRCLRDNLRFKAYNFIRQQLSVFEALNQRMPPGEKLLLSPEPEPGGEPDVNFSAEQLISIVESTKLAGQQTFRFKENLANGVKAARKKLFLKPRLRDIYNLEP